VVVPGFIESSFKPFHGQNGSPQAHHFQRYSAWRSAIMTRMMRLEMKEVLAIGHPANNWTRWIAMTQK
jgi:hypothetical protein